MMGCGTYALLHCCGNSTLWREFGISNNITTNSITMNKASGGDGIPVEMFQILKHDAVKVLHSICQQIWKAQKWPEE